MDHLMNTIVAIRRLQGELSRVGPCHQPFVEPPEGATLRSIAAVERRLRCRLPLSYRTFLHVHDGFPGLLQGARLFATRELGRIEDAAITRAVFAAYETPLPEMGPPSRPQGRHDAMIPFGMDAQATAIFAFNPAVVGEGGEMEVIVWMNGLGDRCSGFSEFLALMREMLESEVTDLRGDLRRSA